MILDCVLKTMNIFNKSYIDQGGNLVFLPGYNIYIQTKDIRNKNDFVLKILVWLSQYASRMSRLKKHSEEILFQKNMDDTIGSLIGKEFTEEDYRIIHMKIGCGSNIDLAQRFKDSGFDMEVLTDD